jgi:hypothetical protein
MRRDSWAEIYNIIWESQIMIAVEVRSQEQKGLACES